MIAHACPVCRGHGTVSKPPYVAGDQDGWVSSDTGPYPCRACNGTGIVWGGEVKFPTDCPHIETFAPRDYTTRPSGGAVERA